MVCDCFAGYLVKNYAQNKSHEKETEIKFNRHEPANIQLDPEGNVVSRVIPEEEVIPGEETEACSSVKKIKFSTDSNYNYQDRYILFSFQVLTNILSYIGKYPMVVSMFDFHHSNWGFESRS